MACFADKEDRNVTLIGGFLVLACGFGLGFGLPISNGDPAPWDRISAVVGWVYFSAWSISFYPQVYLNWKRRSVVGMAFDYQVYNLIGFSCYSAYNVGLRYFSEIKDQYKRVFSDKIPVQVNDVFFTVHAVVLTAVTIFQILIYERGSQRVSTFCKAFCVLFALLFSAYLVGCLVYREEKGLFSWFSYLYALSYVKLVVSLIKYIPQVYLNYTRKSTVGWNIWNVLLDFTGGLLSVAQLLIDGGTTHDWNSLIGNPVKFGLGFCSMFFDICFMVQHYVLYTDRSDPFLHRRGVVQPGDDAGADKLLQSDRLTPVSDGTPVRGYDAVAPSDEEAVMGAGAHSRRGDGGGL